MMSISKTVTSVCILSCYALTGVAGQKSDVKVIAKSVTPREERVDVEVIARFVAFPKEKIDEIVTSNVIKPLTVDDLSTLLKQGDGRIISSPRVITKSGYEAMVNSVVIHRTPQDFDIEVAPAKGTNTSSTVAARPQDWEDIDIGVSLSVTPVVSDDGTKINLDFNPKLTGQIEWAATQASCIVSNSDRTGVDLVLPLIKTFNCHTLLTMQSGTTVIVAGGMSDREEQEEIFVLLTCTVLSPVLTEADTAK